MKRVSNILILILIYFICGSRTCSEESSMKEVNEENSLIASKDSIRKAFEVDPLSNDLLRGYEETAKQKLSDYADYMKIVSDVSLDMTFRHQAGEMVKRLFVSGDIDTRNWNKQYSQTEPSSLNELLEKSLLQGIPNWVQPEQISVLKPLTAGNDSTYTGKLSFYQKFIPFDIQKSQVTVSEMSGVDIYVIKKVKSFGSESLIMWEVNLGNFN